MRNRRPIQLITHAECFNHVTGTPTDEEDRSEVYRVGGLPMNVVNLTSQSLVGPDTARFGGPRGG